MTTLTAQATDWWYVRAYPGRADLLDEATRVVLPWLRAQAEKEGADRWFFMRYLDIAGLHLRLRINCGPDGVDRIHDRAGELTALLHDVRGAGSGPGLVGPGMSFTRPGPKKVTPGLYAPELAKYGGVAGVALAEELFTHASRWYVDNDVSNLDPRYDRAAMAVRYLAAAVGTAMPGREKEFWTAHRKQWGWQLRLSIPDQRELRELLRATADGVAAVTGNIPRAEDHAAVVAETVGRARTAGVPVDPANLLLQYVHLDLNRWGFAPGEECLLGIIASTG
ncbi:lantibiotic dehydratase C-terminal domain-containing protein [Amycolatopsis sp. NPDC059657]|uniref:lantibiotic dehydratase C-terminal domain-containing protein n=1 Tax=Amycolatopsis sp. NPDC059657 TaxID=3346899 RepID=UPI00366A8AC1